MAARTIPATVTMMDLCSPVFGRTFLLVCGLTACVITPGFWFDVLVLLVPSDDEEPGMVTSFFFLPSLDVELVSCELDELLELVVVSLVDELEDDETSSDDEDSVLELVVLDELVLDEVAELLELLELDDVSDELLVSLDEDVEVVVSNSATGTSLWFFKPNLSSPVYKSGVLF